MRLTAILALALAVAALCVRAGRTPPVLGLDECLARPDLHDGAEVCTPSEGVIGRSGGGWFTIRWGGKEIVVRGASVPASPGTYARVRGIFRREGHLEAREVAVGRFRRAKIAVSAAGFVLVCAMLARRVRWDRERRGFALRLRKPYDVRRKL